MNAFGSYQIDLRRSFKKRILGPFDKWPVSNQGSYVFLSLGCNRNRRLHRSEQALKRDLGNTDHAETRRTAPSRALQTCRLKRSLEKCTVYEGFWHFSCRPTSPRRFLFFVLPSCRLLVRLQAVQVELAVRSVPARRLSQELNVLVVEARSLQGFSGPAQYPT